MAVDHRRHWRGDSDRGSPHHSAHNSNWSGRRVPDADRLQRLRALLRLRAARRAARVRLLWQHYRQPVGPEDRPEKSRIVDSGSDCFLRRKEVSTVRVSGWDKEVPG